MHTKTLKLVKKFYSNNLAVAILLTITLIIVTVTTIRIIFFGYLDFYDGIIDYSVYHDVRKGFFVKE